MDWTVKSYENKVLKLEQRLQEETQKRMESEERLKVVSDTATASREQEEKETNEDTNEVMVNELRKKGQELEEVQQQLQETEERLHEQETKREESQRSLETLKKTLKKSETKSTADLDTYFEQITNLSEELTALHTKSEKQDKDISALKRVEKRAEELEQENLQAATRLSETEAEIKLLQAEVMRAQQLGGKKSTETEPPVKAGSSSRDTGVSTEEKLEQEISNLKDKLKARDEELHAIKHGDSPLSNPPTSPTDSMKDSTGEVAALKLKLKEKEQEIQNLKVQVGSVERTLQQHKTLQGESEKLSREIAKLNQEKQALSEHSKKQSHQVLGLKQKLEKLVGNCLNSYWHMHAATLNFTCM